MLNEDSIEVDLVKIENELKKNQDDIEKKKKKKVQFSDKNETIYYEKDENENNYFNFALNNFNYIECFYNEMYNIDFNEGEYKNEDTILNVEDRTAAYDNNDEPFENSKEADEDYKEGEQSKKQLGKKGMNDSTSADDIGNNNSSNNSSNGVKDYVTKRERFNQTFNEDCSFEIDDIQKALINAEERTTNYSKDYFGYDIEPFNMKNELKEGYIDKHGNYIYNDYDYEDVEEAWLKAVDEEDPFTTFSNHKLKSKIHNAAMSTIGDNNSNGSGNRNCNSRTNISSNGSSNGSSNISSNSSSNISSNSSSNISSNSSSNISSNSSSNNLNNYMRTVNIYDALYSLSCLLIDKETPIKAMIRYKNDLKLCKNYLNECKLKLQKFNSFVTSDAEKSTLLDDHTVVIDGQSFNDMHSDRPPSNYGGQNKRNILQVNIKRSRRWKKDYSDSGGKRQNTQDNNLEGDDINEQHEEEVKVDKVKVDNTNEVNGKEDRADDEKHDEEQMVGKPPPREDVKEEKVKDKEVKQELKEEDSNEATANETTTNEATANETTTNEATANEATANEATANEATANEATANEATANETTTNEATANETTTNEATANETTTNEATANETTTNEATTNEATTNEATTNEATANEENINEVIKVNIDTCWESMNGEECITTNKEENETGVLDDEKLKELQKLEEAYQKITLDYKTIERRFNNLIDLTQKLTNEYKNVYFLTKNEFESLCKKLEQYKENIEIQWQFKWNCDSNNNIYGPYNYYDIYNFISVGIVSAVNPIQLRRINNENKVIENIWQMYDAVNYLTFVSNENIKKKRKLDETHIFDYAEDGNEKGEENDDDDNDDNSVDDNYEIKKKRRKKKKGLIQISKKKEKLQDEEDSDDNEDDYESYEI
ncbi:protein GEXP15 [Plasmodium brasilianum]|uniref:Protein GEXP15 n=1 Tax=Plasmodium brasilianum TaxID=5824 RepID=A0ACB9Y7U8_PLABR|nr:protein GEXP15 [Plasmodium brasilianum]